MSAERYRKVTILCVLSVLLDNDDCFFNFNTKFFTMFTSSIYFICKVGTARINTFSYTDVVGKKLVIFGTFKVS